MNSSLKKNLGQLRSDCQPNGDWMKNSRVLLLSKIEADKPQKISWVLKVADAVIPKRVVLQPMAVSALVFVLMIVSGFASVNASKNTLPGDPLYPVKITAENVKYNLTFSNEKQVQVAMSTLERRVSELKMIMEKEENGSKQAKVVVATEQIKNNLNRIKDNIKKIEVKENEKAVATVKEVDEKLTVVKEMIGASSEAGERAGAEELAQVIDKMDETSAVVLTVLAGDIEITEMSDEELREKVNSNLRSFENNVAGLELSDDLAEAIEQLIDEVTEMIRVGDYRLALERINQGRELVAEDQGIVEGVSDEFEGTKATSTEVVAENPEEQLQEASSTVESYYPELIIEDIYKESEEFEMKIGE